MMVIEQRFASLTPSQVRRQVFEEHDQLRVRLVRLQELAREVALDALCVTVLRDDLRTLLLQFARHLDLEEALLMPLIENIDAWGPQRAAAMREEHQLQRSLILKMFGRCERLDDAVAFAIEVDALVHRIYQDMNGEEAELLDADLLRDDVVAIDQTCG